MFSAIASIAAPILGGLFGSSGADKAADAQTQATLAGIKSQERMFDKSLALMEPYRKAGYDAIGGLQGLLDPTQRGQMMTDYYGSPEYALMSQQAEESALRNAAATGNLRGGQGQLSLRSISPNLGMNYLNSRQNMLTGLANMGMGAASQGAQGANILGQSMNQSQQEMGRIAAQNELAQTNMITGALGGIFGAGQNQGWW